MSVSVGPGWTLFTVICRGARVEGDDLDHGRDGGLGHRVDAASLGPRPDRRVAADRHDAAAVVHPGDRCLDGEEDAAHVHVEHQVEILKRKRLD
jgi:hypothetical protein